MLFYGDLKRFFFTPKKTESEDTPSQACRHYEELQRKQNAESEWLFRERPMLKSNRSPHLEFSLLLEQSLATKDQANRSTDISLDLKPSTDQGPGDSRGPYGERRDKQPQTSLKRLQPSGKSRSPVAIYQSVTRYKTSDIVRMIIDNVPSPP